MRLTVLVCGVLVVSGLIAFFVAVRGEEETLIPNVVAEDLLAAISMLQEKSLAPRVEGRVSSDHDKWTVIEQEPEAGTLVKAGRPVLLVVSRGPIIDRVGDYVGRDLDEVRLELQTVFASYRELIKIKEPVARVSDAAAAGTILAQNPAPETPIDGVVVLELVVSKGPMGDLIELQNYVNRPRSRWCATNWPRSTCRSCSGCAPRARERQRAASCRSLPPRARRSPTARFCSSK